MFGKRETRQFTAILLKIAPNPKLLLMPVSKRTGKLQSAHQQNARQRWEWLIATTIQTSLIKRWAKGDRWKSTHFYSIYRKLETRENSARRQDGTYPWEWERGKEGTLVISGALATKVCLVCRHSESCTRCVSHSSVYMYYIVIYFN